MKLLVKIMLVSFLSLSSFCAFGATEIVVDSLCNETILNQLFFSLSPNFLNSARWVNALVLTPEKFPQCIKALQESPLLQAELKRGAQARSEYLQIYTESFDSFGDRNLILTPEAELLRRIYGQLEQGRSKRSEAPPKDWEVRQRALSDTLGRFALNPSMSVNEFERTARSNIKYQSALDYYRRLEYRLRQNMTSSGPTAVQSPESFKSSMIETIYKLRIANFRATVKQSLPDWNGYSLELRDVHNGERFSVPIEDFVTMPVQLMEASANESPDVKISRSLPAKLGNYATTYVLDWIKDTRQYYIPEDRNLNQRVEKIQISTLGGRVFQITGSQFDDILNSLAPKNVTDHYGPDASRHRFRLEAAQRDLQLANLASLLRAQKDPSLEALYKRVKTRIDKRVFDQTHATSSLTYEINIAGNKALESNTSSDLLWSGWRLNPEHWKLRQDLASKMSLYDVAERTGELSKKIQKRIAKDKAKESKKAGWRYLSEAERTQKLNRDAGISTGTFLAGVAAIWFAHSALTGQLSVPDWLRPTPSIASGVDSDSMDEKAEAYNVEIPSNDQDGDGRGLPKTLSDQHDPSTSPYMIEVLYRKSQTESPSYFNFAKLFHLPKPHEYQDVENSSAVNPLDNQRSASFDLAVDVNLRSRVATGRRVGLLEMKSYDLVRLELYGFQNRPISEDEYQIYEVRDNKQVYLRFRDTSTVKGPFTYRAYYRYAPQDYVAGRLTEGLPASSAIAVTNRLKRSGFTQLSEALTQSLDRQRDTSYNGLQSTFSHSATYTFHGGTNWTHWFGDPAFRGYTKFLDKDGKLFYQCTGSNLLFQTFLNEIFKDAEEDYIHATAMLGFASGDSKGVLRGAVGHLHTLVYGDFGRAYMELDATPSGTPDNLVKSQKPPSLNETAENLPGKPLTSTSIDQPWLRPERARLPHEMNSFQEGVNAEPAASTTAFTFTPRNKSDIDLILRRIRDLRETALSDIRPVFSENPSLMNTSFVDIPGLRLLVLSNLLLNAFQNNQTPMQSLAELTNPKSRSLSPEILQMTSPEAIMAMNDFFRSELVSHRRSMDGLEKQVMENKPTSFDFLLNDPIRSRLRELAETLSAYAWGSLLEEYGVHTNNKNQTCEEALTRK